MADSIKIGNLDISAFKVGGADCSIYLGDVKMYPTTFNGLTVTYNISDISQPTQLFYTEGGGVLPTSMIIDETEVEVTNTYQFSTTGEHIVQYSFADNQIPKDFLNATFVSTTAEAVRKVEIGNAITNIGENSFNFCIHLKSCTLGDSLKIIGNNAFSSCALTSIELPGTMTNIGDYAFYDNVGLQSIIVNATTPPVLGRSVFYGADDVIIYVPAASLTDYQREWDAYTERIQVIP